MAPGISYDESGSLASYFGVTFLAIVLVPWTFTALKPGKKESRHPICPCPTCASSPARVSRVQASNRKASAFKRLIWLGLAWALFGYLAYGLAKAPSVAGQVVYNPFEILGLSSASSEKQIKKHYKKLSLQFHPDKLKLSENQTKEDVEEKFVELTKAYKSLTDEVTRENLAKYGNPDGPQQREDKIAIPLWVVEGKNSAWVLAAYGLVLGGGIPWVVGRWWFAQRKLTRDGVLNGTAELFFHDLADDTDFSSLIALLASALEIAALVGNSGKVSKKARKERQGRIEELEKVLDEKKAEFGVEEDPLMKKESRVQVTTAAARRARALIWAHLLRVELADAEQKADQLAILRILPVLLNALLHISLARAWLKTSLLVIQIQPALVQALPADVSPLAQFPEIDPAKATELQLVSKAEGVRWLEKWVRKGDTGSWIEAANVAKYWPRLEVVSAKFTVEGEKTVTPSSITNLVCQVRYVYPTTPLSALAKAKPLIANGVADEKEKSPDAEDSVAAVEDAVSKVAEKAEEKKEAAKVEDVKKEIVKAAEEEVADNGYAHAPYWPQLRKPNFYMLLGDSKLDKVIVPPIKITDIPFPKADGTPSEPKEFKLQFQAPPQANLYSFVAHLRSDTYLGADVQVPIMLKVEEFAAESESDVEDDISEPDEDTLAGQMAMMRGDKVKPSGVHGGDDSDDESDYESSSDEEVDAGPKRTKAYNEDSSDSD
ncbi:hypothetical protein IAT38_007438 [Cryptococcus sp. DSM 104549]